MALAFFAVTVKLSAAVFFLAVLLVARAFPVALLLPAVAWVSRGIALSGYLLYPSIATRIGFLSMGGAGGDGPGGDRLGAELGAASGAASRGHPRRECVAHRMGESDRESTFGRVAPASPLRGPGRSRPGAPARGADGTGADGGGLSRGRGLDALLVLLRSRSALRLRRALRPFGSPARRGAPAVRSRGRLSPDPDDRGRARGGGRRARGNRLRDLGIGRSSVGARSARRSSPRGEGASNARRGARRRSRRGRLLGCPAPLHPLLQSAPRRRSRSARTTARLHASAASGHRFTSLRRGRGRRPPARPS